MNKKPDSEYFKCTRPDGTDFYSHTVDYAAALASGEVIRHPAARMVRDHPTTYLSISTSPSDCTSFRWPCRLFRVEPVGRVMGGGKVPLKVSPNKRACRALRVVEELPAWQAFGPNGEAVVALLERVRSLSADDAARLAAWEAAAREAAYRAAARPARYAAWDAAGTAVGLAAEAAARTAARDAVWPAARDAARLAATLAAAAAGDDAVWPTVRDAVWPAARDAARLAALALLVRDLITPEQFDLLTKPWRDTGLSGALFGAPAGWRDASRTLIAEGDDR